MKAVILKYIGCAGLISFQEIIFPELNNLSISFVFCEDENLNVKFKTKEELEKLINIPRQEVEVPAELAIEAIRYTSLLDSWIDLNNRIDQKKEALDKKESVLRNLSREWRNKIKGL